MREGLSLGSPVSAGIRSAPSTSTGRVGLNFSPKPQTTFESGSAKFNLTQPKPSEIFTPRTEVKKPLGPRFDNPFLNIQQRALDATPRIEVRKPGNKVELGRTETGGRRLPRTENPFGPDWKIVTRAAQRPPVLDRNANESLSDLANTAALKFKEKVTTINPADPMVLLEATEVGHVAMKMVGGGLEPADLPAILASTALIEGVRMAEPLKLAEKLKAKFSTENGETSSRLGLMMNFAKEGFIHAAEHKVADKVAEIGIKKAKETLKKIQTENTYKKLKSHPDTTRIILHARTLVRQNLAEGEIHAQVLAKLSLQEDIETKTKLSPTEQSAVVKTAVKKWVEIKTKIEAKQEEKEEDDEKDDEKVAELDPKAQSERFGHVGQAIAEAPVDENGWVRSVDIAKKLPRQVDRPTIISEARIWNYRLEVYDEEPDGSWPQSMNEFEKLGKIQSKPQAWRVFTAILERNIPIRWRKKSESTTKKATQEQIRLVYERMADEVAREATSILAA